MSDSSFFTRDQWVVIREPKHPPPPKEVKRLWSGSRASYQRSILSIKYATSMKKKNQKESGRHGGLATLKKHGKAHFSKIINERWARQKFMTDQSTPETTTPDPETPATPTPGEPTPEETQ